PHPHALRGKAGDVIDGEEAEDQTRRYPQALRNGPAQGAGGGPSPPLLYASPARDSAAHELPGAAENEASHRPPQNHRATATAGPSRRSGTAQMTAKQSGLRGKVRDGTVVSDKMQKTVVVAVEANFRHRLYKKTVRRVRRLMAHDEAEEAQLGDRVRIIEAAPISRRKRWRLLEVLTRAELPEVAPKERPTLFSLTPASRCPTTAALRN